MRLCFCLVQLTLELILSIVFSFYCLLFLLSSLSIVFSFYCLLFLLSSLSIVFSFYCLLFLLSSLSIVFSFYCLLFLLSSLSIFFSFYCLLQYAHFQVLDLKFNFYQVCHNIAIISMTLLSLSLFSSSFPSTCMQDVIPQIR